jgi:hypothetical protein
MKMKKMKIWKLMEQNLQTRRTATSYSNHSMKAEVFKNGILNYKTVKVLIVFAWEQHGLLHLLTLDT